VVAESTGRPDGAVVEIAEKVMVSETLGAVTATFPDEGSGEYPGTLPTLNEYVPTGSWKVIALPDVALAVTPFSVADQFIPGGRPASENTTGNDGGTTAGVTGEEVDAGALEVPEGSSGPNAPLASSEMRTRTTTHDARRTCSVRASP